MFYLVQFFKATLRSRLLGLFFILSTFALVSAAINQQAIQKTVSKLYQVDSRPYFSALFNKEVSLNSVARKLKKLPGVDKVEVIQKVDPKQELKGVYSQLDGELLNSLKSLNYSSFKIVLSKNIKSKSEMLVKEYLTRLVGKDSLTLSRVKRPKGTSYKKGSLKAYMIKGSHYYVLAVLAFFWLSCFVLFLTRNTSYFYLLEKFQRKNLVEAKTLFVGLTVVSVITIAVSLYFQAYPNYFMTVVALLFMAVVSFIASRSKRRFVRV